jgi:membrane dipeptidase
MQTLTEEQENRAMKLHGDSIVIDALNASIMDEDYFEKIRQGGVTATNYTVAMDQNLSETVKRIADMYRLIENSQAAVLIEKAADINQAKQAGKTGIILGFQNIPPLEGNLRLLDVYHRLGVRIIQLSYHFKNLCGDGCMEPTNSGLSLFGKQLIQRMNELGMVVDLAHVGEQTERDAIEVSSHPVVATHSNCHARLPVPQNKTDDMLRALASKGGVIGITGFPRLLEPDPTVDTLLDHIDHVVNLVGVDHVGIGMDFAEGWTDSPFHRKKLIEIDGRIYDWPSGIATVLEFPNITRGLVARGYSDEQISKILGGNFLRVFREVLG